MDVYLEVGAKKTFAGAIDWPGWCRSARDEDAALEALVAYAGRYRKVAGPTFRPPESLRVIERLKGNSTTDFGAPGKIPDADARALGPSELRRLVGLLERCWKRYDAIEAGAKGKALSVGPRGGGRTVSKIREHVEGGLGSYLGELARERATAKDSRVVFVDAIRRRAGGWEPEIGRRRSPFWPPRYAIRREGWHILDHAWEIEDRAGNKPS